MNFLIALVELRPPFVVVFKSLLFAPKIINKVVGKIMTTNFA